MEIETNDNVISVKTNAWISLFKRIKTLHEINTCHFVSYENFAL